MTGPLRRALAGALVALGALAVTGCEAVLWEGRSPDRASTARVVERAGAQRFERDGLAHRGFSAVAPETIAFAPDGTVAYGARIPAGWTVVVEGRSVLQAAERLALVAWTEAPRVLAAVVGDRRGDRVVVVRDADGPRPVIEHGPSFDGISAGTLVTTAAGAVAYVGFRGGRSHVVVDHREGPAFDGVARLHLGTGGAPSYLARRGGAAWVVRRGRPSGPFDDVADLVLDAGSGRAVALVHTASGWHADDGRVRSSAYARIGDLTVSGGRVAFRASRPDGEVVVVDGVEHGPHVAVRPGLLRLGAERVAFVASDLAGERVLVDGVASQAWSSVEELQVGPDDQVGYVARDGGMRVVVVGGEVVGAFAWAGDLRMRRGGAVFAARVRGQDVVVDGSTRHEAGGLVRGSLRLASDGRTWGALVHRAHGLGLETRTARVELDVGELVDELRRRGQGGSPAAVLEAWSAAALERSARGGVARSGPTSTGPPR